MLRAVGRRIRESGAVLKLTGKWWDGASMPGSSEPNDDDVGGDGGGEDSTLSQSSDSGIVEDGDEQLGSMIDEYCSGAEELIGRMRRKIEWRRR